MIWSALVWMWCVTVSMERTRSSSAKKMVSVVGHIIFVNITTWYNSITSHVVPSFFQLYYSQQTTMAMATMITTAMKSTQKVEVPPQLSPEPLLPWLERPCYSPRYIKIHIFCAVHQCFCGSGSMVLKQATIEEVERMNIYGSVLFIWFSLKLLVFLSTVMSIVYALSNGWRDIISCSPSSLMWEYI